MMVRRIALMQQVAGILTTDQQAKLQELQAQRRARFNEMRERHRRQLGQQQG
jgi:Spy/CpxP family protein refolding chaperone